MYLLVLEMLVKSADITAHVCSNNDFDFSHDKELKIVNINGRHVPTGDTTIPNSRKMWSNDNLVVIFQRTFTCYKKQQLLLKILVTILQEWKNYNFNFKVHKANPLPRRKLKWFSQNETRLMLTQARYAREVVG